MTSGCASRSRRGILKSRSRAHPWGDTGGVSARRMCVRHRQRPVALVGDAPASVTTEVFADGVGSRAAAIARTIPVAIRETRLRTSTRTGTRHSCVTPGMHRRSGGTVGMLAPGGGFSRAASDTVAVRRSSAHRTRRPSVRSTSRADTWVPCWRGPAPRSHAAARRGRRRFRGTSYLPAQTSAASSRQTWIESSQLMR